MRFIYDRIICYWLRMDAIYSNLHLSKDESSVFLIRVIFAMMMNHENE